MGTIDIRFDSIAILPGGPVQIVFGAAPVPPDGYVDPDVATVAALGLPVVDNWQDGKAQAATILQAHTAGTRRHQATTQRFDAGSRIADDVQIEAQQGLRCANSAIDIDMQAARCSSGWIDNDEAGQRIGAPWRIAQRLLARASAGWMSAWFAARRVSALRVDAGQAGIRRAQGVRAPWASAQRAVRPLTAVWQAARRPPLGRWDLPVIPPPQPGCYTPPHGIVNILFDERAGLSFNILFACSHSGATGTIVVPIREVYMTVNTATLIRLDTGAAIPAFSMAMSLDGSSWTWRFSASVPGSALASLSSPTGDPVIVQATINGTPFCFIVDDIARDRVFPTSTLRVQGRGLAAELDEPNAPVMVFKNAEARTGRQLFDDILTIGGVPIDWMIDTADFTDWLVPAGVFSHVGTYISAVNAVANAIGAYVQPHNTDRKLNVLLQYPVPAWEWEGVMPDIELPAAVVSQESIVWSRKAAYNRVFVHGQEGGVICQYTRVGTAGDVVAPTVLDPLITAAAAGRQRGRAILSDGGNVATVTLRLPVLAETGIIKPGKFVRYVDGATTRIGLTRSVAVDVAMPTIYQSIKVETHV